MTDFVHPGSVLSKNDGDRQWVTGKQLIRLYRLNPATAVIVTEHTLLGRVEPDDRHFYVRYDGDYENGAEQ